MSLQESVRLLREIEIFEDFSVEEIKILAFSAICEQKPAGTLLIQEGQEAQGAIIIASGQVEVFSERGEKHLFFGKGAIFRELALIAETSHPFSVRTTTPVETITLSRQVFLRLLEEYPQRSLSLHRHYSNQLDSFLLQISKVAQPLAQNLHHANGS